MQRAPGLWLRIARTAFSEGVKMSTRARDDRIARERPAIVVGGLAAAAILVSAAYPLVLRRRCLTWGAAPDEVVRPLPGDELLPTPDVVATRAITIDAPPSAVWPWLVQMGSGRGGAYTYDWIEDLLGLGMHSADRILPEFQDLAVGDVVPLPNGPGMRIEVLDRERAMVARSEDGGWVWIFALSPAGEGTRLISRNRIATPGASPVARLASMLLMEPGSLVMERRMLRGIKERAEHLAGRLLSSVVRA
jgi:hypothetical protein